MSSLVKLIEFEEGWREKPYLCTEGYPTVGYGFRIGPKGAPLSHYDFILPREAGDAWLARYLGGLVATMRTYPRIDAALKACNNPDGLALTPRQAVLISMAYQMGVEGLNAFRQTLLCIQAGDWLQAETQMLKSRWANQTPKRARRHAKQMRTNQWAPEYGNG